MKTLKISLGWSAVLFIFLGLFLNSAKIFAFASPQEKIEKLENIIKEKEEANKAEISYLKEEIKNLRKKPEKKIEQKEELKKDELSSQEYQALIETKKSAIELYGTPDPKELSFATVSREKVLNKGKELTKKITDFVALLEKNILEKKTTPTPPSEKGPIMPEKKDEAMGPTPKPEVVTMPEAPETPKALEAKAPETPKIEPVPAPAAMPMAMPEVPAPAPMPTTPETTPAPMGMPETPAPTPVPAAMPTPTAMPLPGMGEMPAPAPTTM